MGGVKGNELSKCNHSCQISPTRQRQGLRRTYSEKIGLSAISHLRIHSTVRMIYSTIHCGVYLVIKMLYVISTYVNVKFSLTLLYWLSDQLNREREVTKGNLVNKRCFENRYWWLLQPSLQSSWRKNKLTFQTIHIKSTHYEFTHFPALCGPEPKNPSLPTCDSEIWCSVITCSATAALVANTVMRCATLHGTTSTQTTGTLREVSGDYEMPATMTHCRSFCVIRSILLWFSWYKIM